MSGLEEISSDRLNLVIFPREYSEDRANFARYLGSSSISCPLSSSFVDFFNLAPNHTGKDEFIEDYVLIHHQYLFVDN